MQNSDSPPNDAASPNEKNNETMLIVRDARGREYTLLALRGRGSFGKVYQAEDKKSGEVVAVKLPLGAEDFSQSPDAEGLAKLCAELVKEQCKAAARLPEELQPGRVELAQDSEGGPCLILDYHEDSLLDQLRAGLNFAELCEALNLIARSLIPLHIEERGHGNLKPGNIFFRQTEDHNIEVHLADPATETYLRELDHLSSRLPGLRGWLPPELDDSSALPPVADTFTLAKLLYEAVLDSDEARSAISGKAGPFEGGIDKAALSRFKTALGQRLADEESNPHVRDQLLRRTAAFLSRALSSEIQPSPPYRFYSVDEAAQRLAELRELFHPGFSQLGMLLVEDPTKTSPTFLEGEEIRLSLSFQCQGGLEDPSLITCMTYVRDLEAKRKVKDVGIQVAPKHTGNRFRFRINIPYLPPGQYLARVALAIKGSPGKPIPRDITLVIRAAADTRNRSVAEGDKALRAGRERGAPSAPALTGEAPSGQASATHHGRSSATHVGRSSATHDGRSGITRDEIPAGLQPVDFSARNAKASSVRDSSAETVGKPYPGASSRGEAPGSRGKTPYSQGGPPDSSEEEPRTREWGKSKPRSKDLVWEAGGESQEDIADRATDTELEPVKRTTGGHDGDQDGASRLHLEHSTSPSEAQRTSTAGTSGPQTDEIPSRLQEVRQDDRARRRFENEGSRNTSEAPSEPSSFSGEARSRGREERHARLQVHSRPRDPVAHPSVENGRPPSGTRLEAADRDYRERLRKESSGEASSEASRPKARERVRATLDPPAGGRSHDAEPSWDEAPKRTPWWSRVLKPSSHGSSEAQPGSGEGSEARAGSRRGEERSSRRGEEHGSRRGEEHGSRRGEERSSRRDLERDPGWGQEQASGRDPEGDFGEKTRHESRWKPAPPSSRKRTDNSRRGSDLDGDDELRPRRSARADFDNDGRDPSRRRPSPIKGKPGEKFIPELYYKEARSRTLPGEDDEAFFNRGALTPRQLAAIIAILSTILLGILGVIAWVLI